MSISRKAVLALAICLFTITIGATVSQAQGLKIGFIDDDKIKSGYKEWERAQTQMNIEIQAWDDEATSKQTELQELITEFEKQQLILSEEKKQEREAAILAKKNALDAFTRQVYGPGGIAERKQMDLIGPLLENVNKAIEAVAVEGNFDVVFTMQSGLGYIKESFDVTAKVLEQLEKIEP